MQPVPTRSLKQRRHRTSRSTSSKLRPQQHQRLQQPPCAASGQRPSPHCSAVRSPSPPVPLSQPAAAHRASGPAGQQRTDPPLERQRLRARLKRSAWRAPPQHRSAAPASSGGGACGDAAWWGVQPNGAQQHGGFALAAAPVVPPPAHTPQRLQRRPLRPAFCGAWCHGAGWACISQRAGTCGGANGWCNVHTRPQPCSGRRCRRGTGCLAHAPRNGAVMRPSDTCRPCSACSASPQAQVS